MPRLPDEGWITVPTMWMWVSPRWAHIWPICSIFAIQVIHLAPAQGGGKLFVIVEASEFHISAPCSELPLSWFKSSCSGVLGTREGLFYCSFASGASSWKRPFLPFLAPVEDTALSTFYEDPSLPFLQVTHWGASLLTFQMRKLGLQMWRDSPKATHTASKWKGLESSAS